MSGKGVRVKKIKKEKWAAREFSKKTIEEDGVR